MRVRALVLSLVVGLAGVSVAPSLAVSSEVAAPDRAQARLNQRIFDRVWETVEDAYYDPRLNGLDWDAVRAEYRPQALAAPDERTLYAVLQRMLALLEDGHANVTPPAMERLIARRETSRPVVGLSLRDEAGEYRVDDIRIGTPADEAGIEPGWTLVSVDGDRSFAPDIGFQDGVPVQLGFRLPSGEERIATVIPRLIAPEPVREARWHDPRTLVVRFDAFDPGVAGWVGGTLAQLPEGAGVVLDLRSNPGGRVVELRELLSCFLPAGTPWLERRHRRGREQLEALSGSCPAFDGPLVVLIDEDSASASELTAAVLREQGRARVVGTRSAGEVLLAQSWTLPDEGRLSLSIADLWTAGGVRLERVGVTPDVVAQTTLADRRQGRDPALEAAVLALWAEAD